MSPIDELVREFALPSEEPDAEDWIAEQAARRRLRREMAAAPPGRSRWRLRVPVTVAASMAAVIFAGVALLPGEEAGVPASPAIALERVAYVATHQPAATFPGPHQYLYLKFQEGWTEVENSVAFQTIDTQQDWVAPNGSGRQRLTVDGLPHFLTARDKAAWLAACRPELVPPSTDGTYPAGGYPAGNQLDTSGLPAQPTELLSAIVRRFEHGRFDVTQTFETAGTLLQDSGSPALRAAVYRMVARLPGVELLGRRTDPLGRVGVAVGIVGAGVRDELLFDSATSDVLEQAQVQVSDRAEHVPAGTVLHYVAYEGRGVVDSIRALPRSR